MKTMKNNLFLITLFIFWELNHPDYIITNIALDETRDAKKPHKATVTYVTKKGNKLLPGGTLNLIHQRDCPWEPSKKA